MGFAKFLLMLGAVIFALTLGSTYLKKSPFLLGKMPLDFTLRFKNIQINIPIGTGVVICFVINGVIFITHILTQN